MFNRPYFLDLHFSFKVLMWLLLISSRYVRRCCNNSKAGRYSQRCKKRQIWQMYLSYFSQLVLIFGLCYASGGVAIIRKQAVIPNHHSSNATRPLFISAIWSQLFLSLQTWWDATKWRLLISWPTKWTNVEVFQRAIGIFFEVQRECLDLHFILRWSCSPATLRKCFTELGFWIASSLNHAENDPPVMQDHCAYPYHVIFKENIANCLWSFFYKIKFCNMSTKKKMQKKSFFCWVIFNQLGQTGWIQSGWSTIHPSKDIIFSFFLLLRI